MLERHTLTTTEASKVSGIGVNRIRELCHTKGFPAFRRGRRFLIDAGRLREWLTRQADTKAEV